MKTNINKPIIEVKNLGKKYNITKERGSYIALRDVLTEMVKKPLSFFRRKISEATHKKETFWALKDLNFTVNEGEVVGIIGHNGAGKSTLLKILSQITPPTTGEIILRGRVGSLLEVGTGFHPELTGRENIFLNGAILGMKKSEISKKFDDIVSFAEIGKFIDTPVKYYSSGMYVRLAFSVAAHMETDILIIDEVLAVGDTEFQKKCLGKMEEITGKQGRTILFVSHNTNAITQLCQKVILLEKGKVVKIGGSNEVVNDYLGLSKDGGQKNNIETFPDDISKRVSISEVKIINEPPYGNTEITSHKDISLEATIIVREKVESVFLSLIIFDQNGYRCADFMEIDSNLNATKIRMPGNYKIQITIPGIFTAGAYRTMVVIEKGQETLDKQNGPVIKISDSLPKSYPNQGRAPITPKSKWEYI